MRLLSAALLLVIYGGSSSGSTVRQADEEARQECYICRREGEPFQDEVVELSRQFPGEELPICGRDEPTSRLCPQPYVKGCLTQIRGDKILAKMCSGVEVSDCQEANSVNYCYCKGDLCNREGLGELTGGEAKEESTTPENDDEDLPGEEGGSGDGGQRPTTAVPTTTAQPHSPHPTREPSVKAASSGVLQTQVILWLPVASALLLLP